MWRDGESQRPGMDALRLQGVLNSVWRRDSNTSAHFTAFGLLREERKVDLAQHPGKDDEEKRDVHEKLPHVVFIWEHTMVCKVVFLFVLSAADV